MKAKILSLLEADSFEEYLNGVELFNENIGTKNLPDRDLDQDIIERVCSVFIPEQWAEHNDYIKKLELFMQGLPEYMSYLENDDIGSYLKGLAIFINGLNERKTNVSGFIFVSASGYMMCKTAAEQISEYFSNAGKTKATEFFQVIEKFFDKIVSAQFCVNSSLMHVKKWNESMADGFYNIMTAADFDMQYWMLGSLYKVVNNNVVRSKIFDKYINKLKDLQKKYSEENSKKYLDTINDMLEKVIARSNGD